MNQGPKISLGEAFFLVAFAIIADLINWIPVINWVATAVTFPAYQLYFYMRGLKGAYALGGNIIELIPAISVLPAITAGVVATIIANRTKSSVLGSKVLRKVTK